MRFAPWVVMCASWVACQAPLGPPGVVDAGTLPAPADAGEPVDAGPPLVVAESGPVPFVRCENDAGACARIVVPLDWFDASSPGLTLALERFGPERASTVVVFVNGGPGLSSANFRPTLERLSSLAPDLALVRVDLRGTGASTKVPCEGPVSACRDAVEANARLVSSLTTTAAARDLLALASRLRSTSPRVVAVGQSYGTLVLQRALSLEPRGFDALVLDGPVRPGLRFSSLDVESDAVGRLVLARCQATPSCAARFQPDVATVLAEVMERLRTGGWCPELRGLVGFQPARTAQFFLSQAMATQGGPAVVPSLVRRLDRCDLEDLAALRTFSSRLLEGYGPLESSPVTAHAIARAEFWDDAAPAADRETSRRAPFSRVLWDSEFSRAFSFWPTPAEGPLADAAPMPVVPVLALDAEFDSATPSVSTVALAQRLGAARLAVPGASHGILLPLFGGTLRRAGAPDCVERATLDVVRTGRTTVTCSPAPLDFDLGAGAAAFWYGTPGAWD